MSNSSVATRMREMVLQFESGTLSSNSLQTGFGTCMQAMEQITFAQLHSAEDLIARLILAEYWARADPEFGDTEKVPDVLAELRQLIDSLPEACTR